MLKEIDSISYNQTWKLIELPPRKKLITIRWVHKILNDSSGKPFKFKARLVTKGCEQRE
jgi:ABC-type sulfate transport system substrate-binding protein